MKFPLFVPLMIAVALLDQGTKYLVSTSLEIGQSLPEEGLFRLTYITNTGSIFGLFPNQTFFLTLVSLVAIAILILFYIRNPSLGPLPQLSLGLLLGGALGNLVDRIRLGYVVDFISLGWWPTFNLADSAITLGLGLLAWFLLFKESRGPRNPRVRDLSYERDPGDTSRS